MKKIFLSILVAAFVCGMVMTSPAQAFRSAGEKMVVAQAPSGNGVDADYTPSFKTTSKAVPKLIIKTVFVPKYIPVPPKEDTKEYVIVKGDCLSEIAKAKDTSVEVLMALNHPSIKNPDRIFAGKTIIVPAPYAETKEGRLATANAEKDKKISKMVAINSELQTKFEATEEQKNIAEGRLATVATAARTPGQKMLRLYMWVSAILLPLYIAFTTVVFLKTRKNTYLVQ